MAPSLKISAGSDPASLTPIAVNHDEAPFEIDSPNFRGRTAVRIKSFTGHDPDGVEHKADAKYFNETYRKGITWSIQVQGRFLKEVNTDDVVFGNQFDKPIKDHLPYGTSLALQFVKVVDPNMQHDLYCDKPWAFSPLIATITHFNVQRLTGEDSRSALASSSSSKDDAKVNGYPAFPSVETSEGAKSAASQAGYVVDDTAALVSAPERDAEGKRQLADEHKSAVDSTTFLGLGWPADEGSADDHEALNARKRLFATPAKRQAIKFTLNDVFTADFCNGFIDFNTLSLNIPFSGGLHFDLKKYWDGQPVRYICKNRKTDEVYFVVEFAIEDLHA